MANEHEPGATLNQKFELLEQRIAQLELLLKYSKDATLQPDWVKITSADSEADAKAKLSLTVDSKIAPADKSDSALESDNTSVPSSPQQTTTATYKSVKTTEAAEDSRVRYVIRQWNAKEGEYKDVDQGIKKESEEKKKKDEQESPARAFTYRKTFGGDGRTLESSEIEIEDPNLYEALKKVLGTVYGDSYFLTWPKVYSFASPFDRLVHCYDELERISQSSDADDVKARLLKRDLQLLMETVRASPDVAPYFKARSESPNTITFRFLWTLFPPGTEIVARLFFNQWQIFKVDWEPRVFDHEEWEDKPKTWSLQAWCYDHNGRNYVKAFHTFRVESFEGSKEINQLPFYPQKYFKDSSIAQDKPASETFLNKAIANGDKFKKFCELEGAARMFEYEDSAMIAGKSHANNLLKDDDLRSQYRSSDRSWDEPYRSDSAGTVRRIRVKGRAIVDAEAFLERGNGQLLLGDSKPYDIYEPDEELRDNRVPLSPEAHWARLCPPRIFGYALDQKAMVQFKLANALEISEKKSTDSYNNELQLKKAQKEMLLALVDQHESGEATANTVGDIISDKGRSLVVLLHGPPGVGKTLTAETVAKATGKPLLVVSVAEVGLKADQAESKLERLFDLAAKWEAILLVDEADVFLESRSSDADPERNALVSVLLRVLEYYTGTIILTTNRISSLDIAVQSRIHLSIRYNELSDEDCIKIFELFTSKVEFEHQEKNNVMKWFKSDVADEGLNGRQIRNLVSSAQSIAKSKHRNLDLDCFKGVYKVTQEFQKQLTEQTARYKAANEVDYSRKR